jgi:hypothetical protein
MRFIWRTSFAILCVIANLQKSNAQLVLSNYEIGINAGTLIYQGNLSESVWGYTRNLKPAFGLYGSKSLTEYFSVRANFQYGNIGADESTYASPAYRRHRNLEFSSPVMESSGQLVWDLIGKSYRYDKHTISPYFFIGGGFSLLNINRNWSRFDTTYFNSKSSASKGLGIDTLHEPPHIIPVLPIGMGLRYMIGSQISVNGEFTYRLTTTDYLDGFRYAADPNKHDHYYGFTLGLSYRFGHDGYSCPKVPI